MYRVDFSNVDNGIATTMTVHDEISHFLVGGVLTRSINKSGSFVFSITPDNPGYAMLQERKTEVYIYKKDKIFWTGCVLSCPINMYGLKTVTCEGVLGYLNDTSFSLGRSSINLERFLNIFTNRLNVASADIGQQYNKVKFADNLSFTGVVHVLYDAGFGTYDYRELITAKGLTSDQLAGKEFIFPCKTNSTVMVCAFENYYRGSLIQSIYPCCNAVPSSFVAPLQETIDVAKGGYIVYSNQLGQFTTLVNHDVFHLIYKGKQKQFSENNVSDNVFELDTPDISVLNESFKDAYETGFEKFNNKVLNKFGGMITAKKSSPQSLISLHYRQSLTQSCGQKIVFGNNLVDYLEENSFAEVANVILPLGKNKGTNFIWDYVTIESVNNGIDKLMDDASVQEIGTIQKIVNWPDVEDPATLKSLAQKELNNSVKSDISVTVSAIDEIMSGVDVEAFDIGLLATVEIEPIGVNRELLITSITNNLSEPEKDTYTLGKPPSTSTSYTSGGAGHSAGNDSEEVLEDSGWNTATLASGFQPYNGTISNTPQYRKIGKQVKIRGVLSPTTAIAGSATAKTIFTLPEGFRPSKSEYTLCQGSGKNTWLLTISYNGNVGISRYGTTESSEIPTSAWLPFEHEFYVD